MDGVTTPSRGRRGLGWAIAASVAVILLILLALGFRAQPALVDGPAPGFTLPLFDGRQVSLVELRGQVVVLNFWASWCPPCRDEAPDLESVWQEYQGRGVVVVGATVRDVPSKAAAFAESVGMTFPIGSDPSGRIARAYRVSAVPETFIIAGDGRIAAHFIGPVTHATLGAALDELLQE